MNCYLSRNYKGTDSAGNKAKTDVEQIMQRMGFRNVGLKQTSYRQSIVAFLITLVGVLKAPFCLHAGDILVLQYPLKKYFSFVCRMAHMRKAKVVVLIHDLGSFRRKKLTVKQEINRLSKADYIIAHNDKMKAWLEVNGCKRPIGSLEIFDYLSKSQSLPKCDVTLPYKIVYAGALSPRKNKFLYELINKNLSESSKIYGLSLYGGGFETPQTENVSSFEYMGFVKSDRLIETANGNFGLVWDGYTVDECSGDFGEYLQYNNPHKTSLYLRCGLPVIIWKKAALADFIEGNEIGICVNSLNELEEKLKNLSHAQYVTMCQNVEHINLQLSQGYYFEKAVTKAIDHLSH